MKKFVLNDKVFVTIISILFILIFSIFGYIIYTYVLKEPDIAGGEIVRNISEGSSVKIEVAKFIDGTELVPLDKEYYGFTVFGHINIPKTGVDLPILEDLTVEGMKLAPCRVMGDSELNRIGNNFIEGHNYVNGTQFSDNYKLETGDKIYITSMEGLMKEYEIYDKFVTTPEDVSYLEREVKNTCEITIQTCTNDGKKRIIILAKMTDNGAVEEMFRQKEEEENEESEENEENNDEQVEENDFEFDLDEEEES